MRDRHPDADVLSEAAMDENMGAGRQATARRLWQDLAATAHLWPGAARALAYDQIAWWPYGARMAEGQLLPMDGAGGRPMDEADGEARAERKNNLDSSLSA
jgi:hypothetical protein